MHLSVGVQQVIPLASLQQLEQAGYAEVEFRLQALQLHSESPVPGILTCTDPHITLISLQPRILLIDNFLPPADCQVITYKLISCLQKEDVCSLTSFAVAAHILHYVCLT